MGEKRERLALEQVLLSGIEEMVFIVRVQGSEFVYEFINEAVKAHTKMDESVLEKPIQEMHDEKMAANLLSHYQKALTQKTSVIYEDFYYTHSGELRYSKSCLTPMFDETGRCSHIVSVVNDITEEKSAKLAREEALNRLEESSAKYRSLFESNGDAVFTLTLLGQINGGNRMARKLVGKPFNELAGKDFCELVVQHDRPKSKEIFEEAALGNFHDHRISLLGPNKLGVGALVKFIPILVRNQVTGFYLMAKDMTELDKIVGKYLESEKNFRVIAENVCDVVVLMNRQKECLYVSPSSRKLFGLSPDEASSREPFFNVHPEDLPILEREFQQAVMDARAFSLQHRIDHPFRGWVWTEMSGTPVYDEEKGFSHMVMTVRDISAQKRYEEQLEYYAFHDALTGLPNRRYFQEYSSKKLKQRGMSGGMFALAVLDLDNFKAINDGFGHEMGDLVLKEFASRLKSLDAQSFMPARLGGDEFVVVLEDVKSYAEAEQAARLLREGLEGGWSFAAEPIELEFSLGIAAASASGETVSSILKQADEAMYKAKESNTDQFKTLQP